MENGMITTRSHRGAKNVARTRAGFSLTCVSSEHGYDDFDVSGVNAVHRVCVPHGIKRGDHFNVYCARGTKLGATWLGSVEASLDNFSRTSDYLRELRAELAADLGASSPQARQLHYDRLQHMERVRHLMTQDLTQRAQDQLLDSLACLRGERPMPPLVDLSDAARLATLDALEAAERERRAKPYYVPQWAAYRQIDTVQSVVEAMDRFYKHDRLNQPGGTRARLIADRQMELDAQGFACVASHHDAINGLAVYVRRAGDALTIWVGRF